MSAAALTATAGMDLTGWAALVSMGVLGVSAARKEGPLLIALRLLVLVRAAGMLAREMAAGAWERRQRWEDCKYWAARAPGESSR